MEDFLQIARDRFDFGRQSDAYDRERAEADNAFANADDKDLAQWDEVAKKARRKRPIIQWNRIPVYVQQVVNDGRQNKPAIRISPGDGGSPHTAEYFQARIRHIEYEANADTAKDCARDQQITSGRGFMRVRTEYIPGTYEQRICLDRIENQFSVVFDPGGIEYDRSDAEWAFIVSQISKDAHRRKYGERSTVNRLDWEEASKLAPDWIGIGHDGEMIQIAEYYVKKYRPRTLLLLGSTALPVWKDEHEAVYADLKAKGLILAEREDQCPTIWQYVINGAEVLSETQWIGSTIPIVPFWGREATVNGKRRTYSLVRNAKGPQQLLNLYVSNGAELIGQMPKSPYMVPEGGIPQGREGEWGKVNVEALAWLYYRQYDDKDRPLSSPNRITAEPPIQALAVGINQCIDGIKAAMGIYDASLGARGNETSGIAIKRRDDQASITNYHFPDNEARSNKYLGQILIEILPKLDKEGKSYPIRTEDGKVHIVPIGQEHRDWKTGETVCHDLKSGQYNVTVATGKSYDSQRQEAYDRDAILVQAQPELIWAIGPQMFRNDDTAGSDERAEAIERFANLRFPGLHPEKEKQGEQPISPEIQQTIVTLQQENEQLKGFAQELHGKIETKQIELDGQKELKQMDIDFQRQKLDIETRAQIDLEAFRQGISSDIAALRGELDMMKQERALAAEQQAREEARQHASEMAERETAAALEQQQQQPPQIQQ